MGILGLLIDKLFIMFLFMLIGVILFRKNIITETGSESLANPGFFGIPLIVSVLGTDSVFYVAPFIACLNILQWTYGVAVLKNEKIEINFKKIIKSPFTISFAIGIVLFLCHIPIPDIFETVISTSASLNTPIAMIVSGIYLAKANIRSMLTQVEFYSISLVRLLLIPAISLLCKRYNKTSRFRQLKTSIF